MNQSGYQDLLNNSVTNTDSLVVGILNLPNLNPNSVAYIDASNDLNDIILNDGQLVMGKTGNAPVANTLTGTTDEVNITNAPGSITLSLPQPIATTSSPTFANMTINGNISGPVNVRTADNILSCSTSQTTGDLLSFSSAQRVVVDSGLLSTNIVTNTGTGTTGNLASFVSNKVIQDSGVVSANVVTNAGASTNGNLSSFSGTTGKIIQDTTLIAANVVTNSGVSTNGAVPSFSGTTGKIIQNTSILVANILTAAANGVLNNIPVYNGATRVLQNSGVLISSLLTSATAAATYLALAGGTMTGNINMNVHEITGVSAIRPNASKIIYGLSAAELGAGNNVIIGTLASNTAGSGTVLVGNNAVATGLGGTTIVGDTSNSDGAAGTIIGSSSSLTGAWNSVVLVGSSITATSNRAVTVGANSSNAGHNSVIVGWNSSSSAAAQSSCVLGNQTNSTAANAHVIGNNSTNNTASSVLFGDSTIVNIRADNNNTCDLGATGNRWKDLYATGDIIGIDEVRFATGVRLGTGTSISATGIAIGDSSVSSGADSVTLGVGATASGTHGITIGVAASSNNTDSVCVGSASLSTGANQTVIGSNNSTNTSQYACVFGQNGTSNAVNAIVIATGTNTTTNATASSVLFGDSTIVNIRPDNASSCNLGTTSKPFKVCYLNDAQPASVSRYSNYGDSTLANTNVETSLVSGTSVGSLVYAAGISLGSVIRTRICMVASSTGTPNLTVRIKIAGTAIITHVISLASAASEPIMIESTFSIRSATIQSNSTVIRSLIVPTNVTAVPAFNPAISNTFTITGAWSAISPSNTVTVNTITFETLYST